MDEKLLQAMYENMQAQTKALTDLYGKDAMHTKAPANTGMFIEIGRAHV